MVAPKFFEKKSSAKKNNFTVINISDSPGMIRVTKYGKLLLALVMIYSYASLIFFAVYYTKCEILRKKIETLNYYASVRTM
jgi:hypothetical protein